MKNVEDSNNLAAKIQSMFSKEGATLGSVYLDITDHGEEITPREFVSSLLVGQGTSLPETAILVEEYPAVEFIRHMTLELQEKHIRNEEPFPLMVITKSGFAKQMRTYKQLNDLDCQQLFDKDELGYTEVIKNVRLLEKSLANPDRDYVIKVNL